MGNALRDVAGPSASKPSKSEDLSIDDLLELYLILLDQYQLLRGSLNSHLASGYLALARANFSNPNRVRYGEDFYDDRMQASIRCSIEKENFSLKVQNSTAVVPEETIDVQEKSLGRPRRKDVTGLNDGSQDVEKEPDLCRDPLRWFGILVPPALKDSQASFKNAVIGDIPSLASTMNEMKDLEIRIRRARKKLKKVSRDKDHLQ